METAYFYLKLCLNLKCYVFDLITFVLTKNSVLYWSIECVNRSRWLVSVFIFPYPMSEDKVVGLGVKEIPMSSHLKCCKYIGKK